MAEALAQICESELRQQYSVSGDCEGQKVMKKIYQKVRDDGHQKVLIKIRQNVMT